MILEKLKELVSKGLLTEEELELIKSGKIEETEELPKVDEEVVVEDTPEEEVVEEEVAVDEVVPEEQPTEELPEEVVEEPIDEKPIEEVVEEAPVETPIEEVVEESEVDQQIEEEQEKDGKIEELKNEIYEQKKVIDGLTAKVEHLVEIVSNLSVTQEIDKEQDFGITKKPEVQKYDEVNVESCIDRMRELSSR